jgi:thiamine biosynthesis lipoprotein
MVAISSRDVHVEHVMGTVVSLDIRAGSRDAVDDAMRWLHEVDRRFSTYRSDSAVCRLERGELLPSDADEDVRWVLDRCAELHRETGGFFDVRATGRLDPSALVKGWAAQRAADLLDAGGLTEYCLNAGGDVIARGRDWRVGIQHPHDRAAVAARVLARDLAVATSGAYERGAHIRARHGAPSGVLSVTVTGPDLGTADAYSTAAFAMGAAGPRWTLGLDGYEAMTILADGTVLATPGFPLLEDDA